METSGGVSIVRCLYIDNTTRNPKVKGVNEFINNVIYNWGSGGGYILGDSAGHSFVNVIENYYVNGPSTTIQPFTRGNLNFHIYAQEQLSRRQPQRSTRRRGRAAIRLHDRRLDNNAFHIQRGGPGIERDARP